MEESDTVKFFFFFFYQIQIILFFLSDSQNWNLKGTKFRQQKYQKLWEFQQCLNIKQHKRQEIQEI